MPHFVPAACNCTAVLTVGASTDSSRKSRQVDRKGLSEVSTVSDDSDNPLNGSRIRLPVDGRIHLGTQPFLLARRYRSVTPTPRAAQLVTICDG